MSLVAINKNEIGEAVKTRRCTEGKEPTVFTNIYQGNCNISIWRRELDSNFQQLVDEFLKSNNSFHASMVTSPQRALANIHEMLGGTKSTLMLSEDIAELVDIFCCLFELDRVGLRLAALDRAMCPRFHVDKVPCRLVTTYQGAATEWLPHRHVDRSKLGMGNGGKPDEQSGLFQNAYEINQLSEGDVALLKGERWEGNEGAGLVHRSPAVSAGERRLLLTLDFN